MQAASTLVLRARFDDAPARVFARVSEHKSFFRGPPIRFCRLTTEGEGDRNGLGAVREIHALGLRFCERITAWEPPHAFEYRVFACTLPARHDLGRLEFAAADGGTVVAWTTAFAIPLPLAGPLLQRVALHLFRHSFTRLLRRAGGRMPEVQARI